MSSQSCSLLVHGLPFHTEDFSSALGNGAATVSHSDFYLAAAGIATTNSDLSDRSCYVELMLLNLLLYAITRSDYHWLIDVELRRKIALVAWAPYHGHGSLDAEGRTTDLLYYLQAVHFVNANLNGAWESPMVPYVDSSHGDFLSAAVIAILIHDDVVLAPLFTSITGHEVTHFPSFAFAP